MRLTQHIALSTFVGLALLVVFKSGALAFSSVCTGVLIDVDHWPDYWRDHGWPKRLGHFFEASYERDFTRAWVILHGWEWLVVGWAAAWWSDWNPWMLGAAIGWTHHLVADQIVNAPSRWGYSILWRWSKGFAFGAVFPPLPTDRAGPGRASQR